MSGRRILLALTLVNFLVAFSTAPPAVSANAACQVDCCAGGPDAVCSSRGTDCNCSAADTWGCQSQCFQGGSDFMDCEPPVGGC